MIECTRVFVEGNTEVLLLKRVYNIEDKFGSIRVISSLNGKENVVKRFKTSISLEPPIERGNICYLVDGNDEGFEGIYNKLKEELKVKVEAEKPYKSLWK